MKIAITGSSGLIGKKLCDVLTKEGHEVIKLVRHAPASAQELEWHPETGLADPASLEGVNALVHLAGENIASGRWTDDKKKAIKNSRINGTRLLAEQLVKVKGGPRAFVCASAIGFYGDRGADLCPENSPAGKGFLADVCREWEGATQPAEKAGIRVVNLRLGVVLSKEGGALAKMLPPFVMGAGGTIGDGKQYMSWVTADEVAHVISFVLKHESVQGPVNVVSPHAVTNAEFTRALGRVLKRPTVFPVPAIGARLLFGEMADELLLASTRVEPNKLNAAGYNFEHYDIDLALRHVLGKS